MTKQEEKQTKEEERLEQMKWSIQGLWNQIGEGSVYPPKERDYISPSDLGKDYWGRYQKMTGQTATNPYDQRTLRIFQAGNEFHNLVGNIFKALGIHVNTQDKPDEHGRNQWSIVPETEDCLKTLGKYDNLVGGKPDLEQAEKQCKAMEFSEFATEKTLAIGKHILETNPEGLKPLIYEIKSINSMAFWNKKDYLSDAYPHHSLQLFNYLKANSIEEGRVLYVSKDDLMLAEFPVYLKDPKLEEIFNKDRKEMSYFIKNKIEPPKPEYIVQKDDAKIRFQYKKVKYALKGRYDYNWEVMRSTFFTKMTGFETVDEWKESCKGLLKDKNDEIKDKFKEGLDKKEAMKLDGGIASA